VKIGLVLPTYLPSTSRALLARSTQMAEELGFDSVWTTDHVMMQREPPGAPTGMYGSIVEAVTTMGWLAALTERVTIGVSVLVVPQRQLVLAAKQLATVDLLSDGRLVVCVGAGHAVAEFGYLEADFEHRGELLDDGIAAFRHLWSGSDAPFDGRRVHLDGGHSFRPLPARPGGPPIWVGGVSGRAMRRAAALGDAWHPTRLAPERFAEQAGRLRELADGRPVGLTARVALTPTTSEGEWGSGRGGGGHFTGPGLDDVTRDLEQYARAGCEDVLLVAWYGDPDGYLATVEGLADVVLPRLR